MSMAKYTPGKWKVGGSDTGSLAVLPERHGEELPDGFTYRPVPIARVPHGAGRSEEEAEANACVLSAAPDFADACTGGDPEPDLWSIAYVETLLRSLARGMNEARCDHDADPDAWMEHVREAQTMCGRLRDAMAKAGVAGSVREEEAAPARQDGCDEDNIPY